MLIIALFIQILASLSNAPVGLPYPDQYNYCIGTPRTSKCDVICAKASGDIFMTCQNGFGSQCNPINYPSCNNFMWIWRINVSYPVMIPTIIPKFRISKYNNYYANKVLLIVKILNSVIYTILKNSSILIDGDEVIWPSYLSILPPNRMPQYFILNMTTYNPAFYKRVDNCCLSTLILNSPHVPNQIGLCCELWCNCEYL